MSRSVSHLSRLSCLSRLSHGFLKRQPVRRCYSMECAISPEEMESKYLAQTYNLDGVRGLPGLVLTHGKKAYLYDNNGNAYLDFNSGIAVSAMGHGDEEIAQAVFEQMKCVTHTSNLYHTLPPLKLAETLVENTTFDNVYFANSGTEAVEAALKFSRLYGKSSSPNKTDIIAFERSFHGRSYGSVSCTWKQAYREPFSPLLPGVNFAQFNDIQSLKEKMHDNVCAVLMEPIQGEGGIHPASRDFFHSVRALCDEHNALLICDEVQAGLGRSGYFLAHEPYQVQPDIVTLAKPLGGGLPIGATLLREKVALKIQPGHHGTTFGGNPVVCNAAQVVLNRMLAPGFLPQVRKTGAFLCEQAEHLLEKHPSKIKEVRMPITKDGMFVGIEFYKPVKPLVLKALQSGLLVMVAGDNVLRICPPLIVSEKDVQTGMTIIDSLIQKDNTLEREQ